MPDRSPGPEDFDYELPVAQIAQTPLPQRTASRLLHLLAGGGWRDRMFSDLPAQLRAGDLLVLNDTRVIPARLFGRKSSGGRIELLLERLLGAERALVQLKASHPPLPGATLHFGDDASAVVETRDGTFFVLRFSTPLEPLLASCGHVPLPPYIRRPDTAADRRRYQTVFARVPGAVAAPTAGLHFGRAQLEQLREQGVQTGFLTLHVGAGTFQPLREEQLLSGELHAEHLCVPPALCAQVAAARSRGGRVIAVGSTVMRGLETAAAGGDLAPFDGDTRLFIRPGYRFRVADMLLTNFHLPRSSLLMLVCAFAGRDAVLEGYRHAVAAGYRFYSYGDAMLCHRAGS